MSSLLVPQSPSSSTFPLSSSAPASSLISSPCPPLFTALILVVPSSVISITEQSIIDALSPHIPVVLLSKPPLRLHSRYRQKLSFTPSTSVALKEGLFRTPELLATLRQQAAERFLRWRDLEVEQQRVDGQGLESSLTTAVGYLRSGKRRGSMPVPTLRRKSMPNTTGTEELEWSKERWEHELMALHSRPSSSSNPHLAGEEGGEGEEDESPESWSNSHSSFDPLHLPSLLMLSFSLLHPARRRVQHTLSTLFRSLVTDWNVRLTLLGGFCIGLGVGWLVRA